MDKDYSKREVDNFMEEIHEKLNLILVQTTAHNGRMRKLELWKQYILGMIAGGTIIIGLLLYIWNLKIGSIERDINNIDYKINEHVAIK